MVGVPDPDTVVFDDPGGIVEVGMTDVEFEGPAVGSGSNVGNTEPLIRHCEIVPSATVIVWVFVEVTIGTNS